MAGGKLCRAVLLTSSTHIYTHFKCLLFHYRVLRGTSHYLRQSIVHDILDKAKTRQHYYYCSLVRNYNCIALSSDLKCKPVDRVKILAHMTPSVSTSHGSLTSLSCTSGWVEYDMHKVATQTLAFI